MQTIELQVFETDQQHFMVTFDRPGRIEISVVNGKVIAHVYDGAIVDGEQLPLLLFDGTEPDYDLEGTILVSPRDETGYGRSGEDMPNRLIERKATVPSGWDHV